jgi:uroporphyrin-III C-methyltransferase/precorrin-2 dehydrogenase/sirohydrochlorin ferrochelatase
MSNINSLPILLRNPKILLIGGGKVAYRKAKVLSDNKIDYFVISEYVSDELKKLGTNYSEKKFEKKDASNFDIIIDATGNDEVSYQLKEIKHERFFLLNTVDNPNECNFYFSSLLQYNNLKIAISSDGVNPTLTQVVREKIKSYLPNRLENLVEQKLFERKSGIIDAEKTKAETNQVFGKVYLIGCGTGDPELLTIKAYKAIQSADVVLYDQLVTDEILEVVPKHVDKIFVGKSKGNHSISQMGINQLLLDYARLGYKVARLKNGDPFIFGRGAEEAEFLVRNEIEVEVIPGISSAFAAPLSAGIPPTARGYASSVSIVTAHLDGGIFNDKWIDLLKMEKHTTIVLMGLSQIENIVSHAFAIKVKRDLPAAIISNATRKNQKIIVSTLENLIEDSKKAERPAAIVFGEVVKYSETHSLIKISDIATED